MATIVEHVTTGKKFVLMGTGFGAFRAIRPSLFFGNLAPAEEEGMYSMAAVCDNKGKILWIDSDELIVIEIDGFEPEQALT